VATAYVFTPTQMRVDPVAPVRDWRLSDEGRARVLRVVGAPWTAHVKRIVTSTEYSVIETANMFARRLDLPVEFRPELDDSRRPSSAFLPVNEFDRMLDAFFARPEEGARPGWESAAAAQRRAVAAVDSVLEASEDERGDLLFLIHGRIATLLLCHLAEVPISREFFQPMFGGNLFAFDPPSRKVLFHWRRVAPPL
jgi:broad specificity phosphatase PhoE